MGPALQIALIGAALAAMLAWAQQAREIAAPILSRPARQIAYNMLDYHGWAVALLAGNPSATGILLPLESAAHPFFTDSRFTACTDRTTLATWFSDPETALSAAVYAELQRQQQNAAAGPTTPPAGYGKGVIAGAIAYGGAGIAQAPAAGGQLVSTATGQTVMPAGCQAGTGAVVLLH